MGWPKGLLDLDGTPVLVAHVTAYTGLASRIVVVLGFQALEHAHFLPPWVEIVRNAAWESTWPADSLHLAITRAGLAGPLWVSPVDTAPPTRATLTALAAHSESAVPVGPDGRGGHPVWLSAAHVAEVGRRAPPGGLRTLLGAAARVPVANPAVSLDFDTPEAWSHFLRVRATAP